MADVNQTPYPDESLDEMDDDGTIVMNVEELEAMLVGRRIVDAEQKGDEFFITLDNQSVVTLRDTNDCCASTSLHGFWRDPASVDHVILGIGTTDKYCTWHICADFGDVMRLEVGWSPGNPFYYAYGFELTHDKSKINFWRPPTF